MTEHQANDEQNDFRHLPEPIRLDQMIATQEVDPAPDPRMGRDTDTEFMLRNAGA